jgi:hypothetical protein
MASLSVSVRIYIANHSTDLSAPPHPRRHAHHNPARRHLTLRRHLRAILRAPRRREAGTDHAVHDAVRKYGGARLEREADGGVCRERGVCSGVGGFCERGFGGCGGVVGGVERLEWRERIGGCMGLYWQTVDGDVGRVKWFVIHSPAEVHSPRGFWVLLSAFRRLERDSF